MYGHINRERENEQLFSDSLEKYLKTVNMSKLELVVDDRMV